LWKVSWYLILKSIVLTKLVVSKIKGQFSDRMKPYKEESKCPRKSKLKNVPGIEASTNM
jgi:hypothetical protein